MDRGLTQQTLAAKLGCWYQSVAAWERDESEPRAVRWPRIEAILGTDLVPERNDLPGRIRTTRLRLGLTQEEVARRSGLDIRTIRNGERGAHPPSRLTIRKLRDVLGDTDSVDIRPDSSIPDPLQGKTVRP
jgi:transcriptional regulator with XRE-family HTH domain